MKFKQKILSVLLLTALSAATIAQDETKQVTINGIELNEAGIAKLKDDDNVKIIRFGGADAKIGDIMKLVIDDGHDKSDNKQVKIITKKRQIDSSESATMGFMASIKDDGWYVISVVAQSGAADAGVLAGDVITKMGDVDLTRKIEDVQEIIELTQWQVGEIVDVELIRDNQVHQVSVEARKNDSADIVMNSSNDSNVLMLKSSDLGGLSKAISVMVSNNNHNFNFDEDDINMIFPDNLSDLKVFIAQGESTSDLLGKNHELSTLSEGLSRYFKTKGGVLVLRIDKENAFSLEEGDVIKSINGTSVKAPKDVIKALLKTERQQDIKIKIVRHKRDKTLKYNK